MFVFKNYLERDLQNLLTRLEKKNSSNLTLMLNEADTIKPIRYQNGPKLKIFPSISFL